MGKRLLLSKLASLSHFVKGRARRTSTGATMLKGFNRRAMATGLMCWRRRRSKERILRTFEKPLVNGLGENNALVIRSSDNSGAERKLKGCVFQLDKLFNKHITA